jgi:hypothetical protein
VTNCDDLSQQLQRLTAERDALLRAANAAARAGSPDWALNPNATPEDRWRAALDAAYRHLDDEETQALISRSMEAGAPTNIGDGQPTPIRQLLKQLPVEIVEDYAQLQQLVIGGWKKLDPGDYAMVTQSYGDDRVVALLKRSYADFDIDPAALTNAIAKNAAPFYALVERMARLRGAAESFAQEYLSTVNEAAEALLEGGANLVTPELKQRIYKLWKLALISQRGFDLARRRTGQTLRSLQVAPGDAERLLDPDLYLADKNMVQEQLGTKPADVEPGKHIAQVMDAIDDAKANPARGGGRLQELVAVAQVDGLDPRAKFASDKDWYNHNLLGANLLAKDSMLLQTRTQIEVNLPSNFLMALYGPYRQTWANYFEAPAYGTQLTRGDKAKNAWLSSWNAWRDAAGLMGANARMLFADAFLHGKPLYGSNVDLKLLSDGIKPVDMNKLEIARMREINTLQFDTSEKSYIGERLHHLLVAKTNAGFRLFLHDQFGIKNHLLRPGIRLMSSVDNVAGYFFHAYKLRNDLYMEARSRAGELGLQTEDAIRGWVDERFDKEYLKVRPSEQEVKARRRQDGIGADVSDQDVGLMIAMEKIRAQGKTSELIYGVPNMESQRVKNAANFSQEMRFQGGEANSITSGLNRAGKNPLFDTMMPFRQAPVLGTLLDLSVMATTLPPIHRVGAWNKMSPSAKARTMSAWAVSSTVLGLFTLMDAADGDREDLIIGNGPTDPKERTEWLARLRAQGKKPNSIAGLSVAGLPILNTLMLWRDLKSNFITGEYSKYDEANALTGFLQVLTGYVMRMTGVQQLQKLLELLQSTRSLGERAAEMAGYMAGSYTVPFVGATREAAKRLDVPPGATYKDKMPGGPEREADLDWDYLRKTEKWLRDFAYSYQPALQRLEQFRREKDHFGVPLRVPFGVNLPTVLQERFFPQLWPKGYEKTYAELDRLNELRPPRALLLRSLDGVSMTGALQEEYRDAFASTKGGDNPMAEMTLLNSLPKVTFDAKVPIDMPDTGRQYQGVRLGEYPLAQLVAKHVAGKTVLEAFTSLFQDPIYKRLQSDPATTADRAVRDQSPSSVKKQLPKLLAAAITRYFESKAHTVVNTSNSPAAIEWRNNREILMAPDAVGPAAEQMRRTSRALQGVAE